MLFIKRYLFYKILIILLVVLLINVFRGGIVGSTVVSQEQDPGLIPG